MPFGQGNAALGSLGIRPDDMQKNGTSVVLNAGALVMTGRDNQVIGSILAPQVFMARIKW